MDAAASVTLTADLSIDCSSLAARAASPADALLALRGVQLLVDCGRGLLVVVGAMDRAQGGAGRQMAYSLGAAAGRSAGGPINATVQLTLEALQDTVLQAQQVQQRVSLCVDGARAVAVAPPLAYSQLLGKLPPLAGGGVALGALSDSQRGARATLRRLWLLDVPAGAAACSTPAWSRLEADAAANALPEVVLVAQLPAGELETGASLELRVEARDADGDDLK